MLTHGQVYRCCKVYKKSWKVLVIPYILWILGAMVVIWSLYLNIQIKQGSRLFQDHLYLLECAFWALTVALNIYTTCESNAHLALVALVLANIDL